MNLHLISVLYSAKIKIISSLTSYILDNSDSKLGQLCLKLQSGHPQDITLTSSVRPRLGGLQSSLLSSNCDFVKSIAD